MALFPSTGFPLEIYEAIIDFLPRDVAALKACCMTCRAFVRVARSRIFHTVILSTRAHAQKLVTLLQISDEANSGLHVFMRYLEIAHPEVPNQAHYNEDRSWQDDLLPIILPQLISVRRLVLLGLTWQQNGAWEIVCTSVLSATVTELYLGDFTFETPADVFNLLLFFPRIHDIHTTALIVRRYPPALTFTGTFLVNLTTLVLSGLSGRSAGRDIRAVIERILLPPFELQLRVLDWESKADISGIALLGEVLRRSGPNLQRLLIHLGCTDFIGADAALVNELSIKTNINVSTLRLGCRPSPTQGQQLATPENWIPMLISQLTRAHMSALETIEIDFAYLREERLQNHLSRMDWDALDQRLSDLAAYASPQLSVCFLLGRQPLPMCIAITQGISARLPKSMASRIPLNALVQNQSSMLWEMWNLATPVLAVGSAPP